MAESKPYKQDKLKFPFWIAKRYLFSKKSHNAINWITGISAAGVAVGTAALVIVLSVFNGFGTLITGLFSQFDPDLKISLVQGKTFDANSSEFQQLKKNTSVAVFTEIVEDNALIMYNNKQMPVTILGVSNNFEKLANIDSIMFDGKFDITDSDGINRTVVGYGVASVLGVSSEYFDPLVIYAPKRTERINMVNPENSFNEEGVDITGIFFVKQAEYDDKYMIVPISMAQRLFEYSTNEVTSVELKLKAGVDKKLVQKNIQKVLGDKFKVQNRYEQQESFFKIMKIEKWITYLILSFILLIAVFNIIGSLSMLIIDKQNDIVTLRNMGAENNVIKRIFLFEGWLISLFGAFIGIVLGTIIALMQQYFGLVKLGEGANYIINAYPVVVKPVDILLVLLTVMVFGFLAALYPVKYISVKNNMDS